MPFLVLMPKWKVKDRMSFHPLRSAYSCYYSPVSASRKEPKPTKIVVEGKKDIKGLIAFYPNIGGVQANKLTEYLDRLADDNAPLVASFNDCAYKVIWLPVRSEKSSHMEIWPLCHSKKKLISFVVDCSKVAHEKRGKFGDLVLSEFIGRYDLLAKQLKSQGFLFSWRSSTADNRIVVY